MAYPSIPTASTRATHAANRVAFEWPTPIASSDRSTRPPSIGSADSMLNTASIALLIVSHAHSVAADGADVPMPANASPMPSVPSHAMPNRKSSPPMATLTSGPAIAINSSWPGVFGFFVICATPPIGSRMISRTGMPNPFATSECPSSCSTTQTKSSATTAAPKTAPEAPKRLHCHAPAGG